MRGDINYLVPQSCHRQCGNAMTFRETMKNLLFVVYVLHDDMMNGWLIFNRRFSDVRADLHITAHVCGALWLTATLVNACVYTGHAAARF